MARDDQHTAVAVTYARAILELAHEQQQAEAIGKELNDLRQIVRQNASFDLFLRDPSISVEERRAMLERTLKPQISPLMWSFLGVLNQKHRLGWLARVADAYGDLYDALLGKVNVSLTVAKELDAATLEDVRRRVSEAMKKDAMVSQSVDESIIGGLVLSVDDKVIDGSVKAQLEAMRRQLVAAGEGK